MRVLGSVFVLLVATLIAGVAVLKSTDYNRFKGVLETLVEDATGRQLTIAGELQLAVSLNPTLYVTGVSFGNADWASKTPMMTLDRMEAQVALKPLLSGLLEIDHIVLDGVNLVLETDGQGRANWEFDAAGKAPADFPTNGPVSVSDGTMALKPEVRDVRLRNVRLTYIDGATGGVIVTDLKRADFSAATMDSALKGVVEAVYNDVTLEAQAELGSLDQLIGSAGKAFPVKLKISAPGLSADIVGSVEQPSAGMAVDLRVSAQLRDMATVSKLAGVELPNWPGIKVRATVTGGGTAFSFKGLEAFIGDSDLKGSVDLELAGNRPRVVAKLSSITLDVNALAGIDQTRSPNTATPDRVFSDDPLPFGVLKLVDGEVRYRAQKVLLDALTFDDVKANVSLKDGKLVLKPLSLSFNKGRIVVHAEVEGGLKTPKLNIRASGRNLDANSFAALAGREGLVSLKLDGEVNLKGAGNSVHTIMAGLNGTTNLVGRNGRIFDDRFKELTTGIGSILPWVSNKDANVITCMVAKVPIVNGEARAQTVILDTSGVVVKITGNVDLGGERLHLTVHTDAKKTSLSSLAVPFRIKGSLVEPRIDVDPGEAVVGTVGNIVKAPAKLIAGLLKDTISLVESDKAIKEAAAKDDPCIQALAGGKTSPKSEAVKKAKPAPPPQEVPVDKNKSTGDPLKDVENFGKALKNLF
ncbi:MAG: AsmA family protein [Magnetovibrio sp.]|nr:AsmA family protein [Magnetovibrio sp.]